MTVAPAMRTLSIRSRSSPETSPPTSRAEYCLPPFKRARTSSLDTHLMKSTGIAAAVDQRDSLLNHSTLGWASPRTTQRSSLIEDPSVLAQVIGPNRVRVLLGKDVFSGSCRQHHR